MMNLDMDKMKQDASQQPGFRPCILIPIYNHGGTIKKIVEELQNQFPIVIVNDGSTDQTAEVLNCLKKDRESMIVYHRLENGGKGAALRDGFRITRENGYSHAIQIDADGQHNLRDLPDLIAKARIAPDALILGNPVFDESAPLVRVWGRKLTRYLVWLETLSTSAADGLCGFRIYPVEAVNKVLGQNDCGSRMQFDPALLVRLIWSGVPIVNVPTRVVYPEKGISHFRMTRDNLLIAWSHICLVCGMIVRIPRLLTHSSKVSCDNDNQHWAQINERGNAFAVKLMIIFYKILGRKIASLIAWPVSLYFYFTGGRAKAASKQYLENWKTYFKDNSYPNLSVRKHFHEFALNIVDKLAVWAGDVQYSELEWENRQEFYDLIENKKGFVILGAHLGNIEIGRALSRKHSPVKVNAMMYRKHAQKFQQILRQLNLKSDFSVIALEDLGSETILGLKQKIAEGELVTILADRVSAGSPEKVYDVDFLGQPASFPVGPWLMASLLACPVYTMFFFRKKNGAYKIVFSKFDDRIELPRENRQQAISDYLNDYVRRIEEVLRLWPLQWFNFYDYWS